MEIIPIFARKLFACWNSDSNTDEFTLQFRRWNDPEYLYDFFTTYKNDLSNSLWRGISIEKAVKKTIFDAVNLEAYFTDTACNELDKKFRFLSNLQTAPEILDKSKSYGIDNPSWLRLYGLRIESNVYVITGGAVKLTRTMNERCHTKKELWRKD